MTNVPEGSYTLTVSATGHTTHTETINVESDSTINITLTTT